MQHKNRNAEFSSVAFIAACLSLAAWLPVDAAGANEAAASETTLAGETAAAGKNVEPGKSSAPSQTPAPGKTTQAEIPPPFKIAGQTSRNIQKYSGLTWLTEEGLGIAASLAAKVFLHGHPSCKVEAYSFTDCLGGKFKNVSINLKDCSYKKVPLADLCLKTSTPLQFRLFKSRRGAAGVAAPVMVAVSGVLDESDVSKALQSPPVSSQLGFLRLSIPGLGDQHLQVVEPEVKLEDGKVKINTGLITAGAPRDTGISLSINASPRLEGDRFILLKNTQVSSPDIVDPEHFSSFSQDLLNPLLDFARFDRKTHAFRLTEFNLAEKKLQFAGKLLLVPRPVQATEAPRSELSQK